MFLGLNQDVWLKKSTTKNPKTKQKTNLFTAQTHNKKMKRQVLLSASVPEEQNNLNHIKIAASFLDRA